VGKTTSGSFIGGKFSFEISMNSSERCNRTGEQAFYLIIRKLAGTRLDREVVLMKIRELLWMNNLDIAGLQSRRKAQRYIA
jgi:hypothetical protein